MNFRIAAYNCLVLKHSGASWLRRYLEKDKTLDGANRVKRLLVGKFIMVLRIFLLIAIIVAAYIIWTRKSAQERPSQGTTNQLNLRVLIVSLSILGSIVIFVMAAELITRL